MDEDLFTYQARRRFVWHYIPTLLLGMCLTATSMGCMWVITVTTYLGELYAWPVEQCVPAFVMLSSILTAYSGFMIARGWSGWVWVKVVVLVFCFLTVLPAFQLSPHRGVYFLGLLFPLLGLLTLNTSRYREFREKCVAFRHQREADERAFKARRVLEQKRAAFRARRAEARLRKATQSRPR